MRKRAVLLLAGSVAVALLVAFPLYHRLGAKSDVLTWSAPEAWGPGTTVTAGIDGRGEGVTLRFAPAARVDQGVTFRLQHDRTRAFRPEAAALLRVVGCCAPAPCTLEVRVLAPDTAAPPVPGTSWPWVTLGVEDTEQALPLAAFGPAVARDGVVAVTVARTEQTRHRDGAERGTQAVEVTALTLR